MSDHRGYITSNRYFRWRETVVSKDYPDLARKIKKLSQDVVDNIIFGVEACLDPLRNIIGPVLVLSWYRDYDLNKAVGGSRNSDHLRGNAVDVCAAGTIVPARKLFTAIVDMGLPYRQLILYNKFKFIHWSWNIPGRKFKHESNIIV